MFIGGLFVLAAREFAPIAERHGQAAEACYYRTEAEKMAGVIAEHGWDGAWFRRAYDHSGQAVGSAASDEGQIFIEPQGMCVMSGVGLDDGVAVRALDSVRERLATSHGILLPQPAYTRYHLELGEISSYPPGYKENGSVFCHTNPWVMIAEAMADRGDAAGGPGPRGLRGRPGPTLLTVALGVMMVALDGTIVAVANPASRST